MELNVGGEVSARADVVVVETAEQVVARGVRVETGYRDGFVLEAPLGRLDAGGRLLVLEGGVRGYGSGVVMESLQVAIRYDSSNRLVGVEASGEVEVTKTPWIATGDQASVDWLRNRLELSGNVRLSDGEGVSVGGVVGVPLDGGDVVCEGCQVGVAGESD